MPLTLLRHTTPAVAPGTCYGRTDLDLAGSFEAELAAVLADLPRASVILSSPLQRCARLARAISLETGLEMRVLPHWIEMDFGAWEGVAWSAIPRPELDAWAADFFHARPHGGESVWDLRTRVAAGLDAAPDNALVVTHMGVIKAALALAGRDGAWDHKTPFGGMERV